MSIGLFCRRLALVGVLSLTFGTTFGGAAAHGESLGFFESRRVVKQADQAFSAGQYGEAIDHYGKLIAGLDPSDERHAQALYRSALSSLAKSPSDPAAAEELFNRLPSSFSALNGAVEAGILKGLLSEMEQSQAKTQQAKEALAKAEQEANQAEAAEAAEAETEEDAMQKLQGQNRRLKAQLKELQEELARKDEALEKLKEVVVGGG